MVHEKAGTCSMKQFLVHGNKQPGLVRILQVSHIMTLPVE